MLVKRAFDILVSAAVLILAAPLFALLALLVRLDSGPPVFFTQQRIGLRFRPFRIWKFRTMQRTPGGASITSAGDPRVTRIGRLLRATKLDELPQFWNVLRGDMSLVGPRPEVPEYVDRYRSQYGSILRVRPGITDLASIRFHDEEAILAQCEDPQRYYVDVLLPWKLELAKAYLDRRSLFLDLNILFRTVAVLLSRT